MKDKGSVQTTSQASENTLSNHTSRGHTPEFTSGLNFKRVQFHRTFTQQFPKNFLTSPTTKVLASAQPNLRSPQ